MREPYLEPFSPNCRVCGQVTGEHTDEELLACHDRLARARRGQLLCRDGVIVAVARTGRDDPL